MAADSTGMVHLMWTERPADMKMTAEGLYFMYARFDGTKWTTPVDVLASLGIDDQGDENGAESPNMAYTPDGFLHLVWGTGGEGSQLMYARAPACCADKATSWTKPIVLGVPVNVTSALVADGQGRLHAVFADSPNGNIFYMRSDDSGLSWNLRRQVQGKVRVGAEYPAFPRIAVDRLGRVHLAWTIYPWPGIFALYANSEDGGETWSEPQIIDRGDNNLYADDTHGPIYIAVYATTNPQGQDRVHLIWDGPPTVERNYVYSDDAGKTWSRRYLIFPEIYGTGRGGFNPIMMDSAGTLHATSFDKHSIWLGNGWQAPSGDFNDSISPEQEVALFSLGNQLNVAWQDKYGEQIPATVSFAFGIAAAPRLEPRPLPNIPPEILELQPVSPGLKPKNPYEPTKAPVLPTPIPTLPPVNPSPAPRSSNPMNASLIGVAAVAVFLVAMLFAVSFVRARRR
jgi:hypothetical protein